MKVYFDLDSVLADFRRGVKELCGMEPSARPAEDTQQDEAMWEAIRNTAHFYNRLELMPGAKEMFDLVCRVLEEDCQILTAVPRSAYGIITAEEDKLNWVHRMLHPEVTVHFVTEEQKKDYCTDEDCILVDGQEEAIKAWVQCGGTGILFTEAECCTKILRKEMKRALLRY